jgi:predicted component of type VI protein secretion system
VRTLHWERYEQIREQYAQKVEATVTNDLRDAAREALETQRIAVQKARERLEADKDDDPARSAANLARVTQSNADKLLSLTGRPTQITESRNVNEMLRGLIAAFPQVFSLEGQEPEQIEGSEEVSP